MYSEGYLYGLFFVIFGIILWPQKIPFLFTVPRLDLLLGFAILAPIVRMLFYPEIKLVALARIFWKQPLYIKLLPVLGLCFVFSTWNSPLPTESWFGGDSNQTGVYLYILLLPLFWCFSSIKNISDKYFTGLILISALITITEFIGFRPLSPITDVYQKLSTAYPAFTIGYRGQLAGFLLPLGGLLLFWFQEKQNNSFYWMLTLIFCIALGCCTNSASLIGFLIGIILLIFLNLIRKQTKVLLLLLCFMVGYFLHFPLTTLNVFLYNHHLVTEKSDPKDLNDSSTLKTRLILWKAGINMFKAKPLIGWGAQNYSLNWFHALKPIEVDKLMKLELGIQPGAVYHRIDDIVVYKPNGLPVGSGRIKYFSAHNGYIDYLYSFGILGLSVILVMFISISKNIQRNNLTYVIIALTPYAIYLMAWFITVPAIGLAVMVFAYLISQTKKSTLELIHEE